MVKIGPIIATVVFFLFENNAGAQSACPSVTVSPSNISICSGCTTLTATVQGSVATTSYSVASTPYTPYPFNSGTPVLVNIDDEWSQVITLPFCFQFYGNTYTQCLIGSNAVISFNLANAGAYNTWPISAPAPSTNPADLMNCIMGPWHDIDPSVGGNINYATYGTAPCRAFVVSWNQVPMFMDNSLIATSQIVLYETTNIIDIYIQDKPIDINWNGGAAIEGIQNASGTQAVVVPGRNFPTQWAVSNDGQRFTPTGIPQYTLTWYEPPNTAIGTASTVSVCPSVTTTYTAVVVNNSCAGPITVTDVGTVTIGFGAPPAMTSTPAACTSNNGSATATPSGGQAPYTYSWSTSPPQNTQTATGLAAGVYSVTVTDATGCSGVSTVTVSSTSGLAATATSTPTSCSTNAGTATAAPSGGTAPFTYSWSTTPVQNTQTATGLGTGTYTVVITDANGCSTNTTATVTAPNGITSVTMGSVPTSCSGGNNGTATVTPSGGTAPYSYLWSNGQNTQTATGLSAGSYSVTVTDANGCTFPGTVSLTSPSPILFSPSSIPDTCGMKEGSATANPSGGTPPYTYMWLTSPIQSVQTATSLLSGSYTCIVTDASGCTVISGATVGNVPGPTANFTASPSVVDILSPNVSFIDLSVSNIINWQWSLGDGGTSVVQNPDYTYQSEGTFIVTLIVTNASGCKDTIQQTVVVEGYSTFYVPNTITPNNDGKNDFFFPVFTKIDESNYSMMIFDRWGNLIFKSTELAKGWDGKVKRSGETVQEDVYVYSITYHDLKKAEHRIIGHVNVVR